MTDLPRFQAPPVVEVVLSLQFSPLENLSAAHVGWYWREHLGDEWRKVTQQQVIDDVIEKFGDDMKWRPEGEFKIEGAPPVLRLQFVRSDDERMIQVQRSRFVYNWRKRSADYPSFDKLLPEFEHRFHEFSEFTRRSGVGDVKLNQWEITYVDQIQQGTLWDSPRDWRKILPSLAQPADIDGQAFETQTSAWQFVLGDAKGRLRVHVKQVKLKSGSGPLALHLQFTARGPVEGDFRDGLHRGHRHAVQTFCGMTSEYAHRAWKRSR